MIFSKVSLIATANLAVLIFMRSSFTRDRRSVGTSSGDTATPYQVMSRSWASGSGLKGVRGFASFGMANTRYNVGRYGGSASRVHFFGALDLSRECEPIEAPRSRCLSALMSSTVMPISSRLPMILWV